MSRAPWTSADDATLQARYKDPRQRARLPDVLGRSRAAIRKRAHQLGLTTRPPKRWAAWEDAALRAGLLPRGRTWASAAWRWLKLHPRAGREEARTWEAAEDLALYERRCPPGRTWPAALERARFLGLAPAR